MRRAVAEGLLIHPRIIHQHNLRPEALRTLSQALPELPPFRNRRIEGVRAVLDWDHRLPSKSLTLRLHVCYTATSLRAVDSTLDERRAEIRARDLYPEFDVPDYLGLPADEVYDVELRLDLSKFKRTPTPGHEGVEFLAVTPLRGPAGEHYAQYLVDPEGLRIDAARQRIYWSGEGMRKAVKFVAPSVRVIGLDGQERTEWLPPEAYIPAGSVAGTEPGDRGVRDNLGFESLTLTPDGKALWTATEVALTQDDEPPTLTTGSQARLLSFDAETGRPGAEFVYTVEPLPVPANPPSAFAVNGLVELLALDGQRFLALERSYSQGGMTPGVSATTGKPTGNVIRLFLIDTASATNVAGWPSLRGREARAVSKRLLLDLTTLHNDDGSPLALDNVEGLSWGPELDGKRTLLLVSDNDFSGHRQTHFIALVLDGAL
mgnify:CR=1 FL=1